MNDESKFQRGTKGWTYEPDTLRRMNTPVTAQNARVLLFGTRQDWSNWWRNRSTADKLYGAFVLGGLAMLLVLGAVKFLG